MTDEHMTPEQEAVIRWRKERGYTVLGVTRSRINNAAAIVLQNGRHTMVVNSLGYDEHCVGRTWRVE